ncbi:i-AAA protease yme1 [Ophidiomyces ophidiicola]|nr:i-AAA protease yme1 [Ophidiomyces ophidiicola]KAI1993436.1 i-AAA protease yme1 [Ophidiomyces ophidiicola]KAI1997037.1 i-AAA protease yme1 [Ophidiomyces ophidiicola]
MAFHTPISLPNVASVTSELWPSVANAFTAPWKTLTKPPRGSPSPDCQGSLRELHGEKAKDFLPSFPECLGPTPIETLKLAAEQKLLRRQTPKATLLSQLSSNRLWPNRNFRSPSSPRPNSIRSYSTFSVFSLNRPTRIPKVQGLSQFQQHRFLFGGPSQSTLRYIEQNANNSPSSAASQNAFYAALLRAKMPAIVIERYQSGGFASNTQSTQLYMKALQQVGSSGMGQTQNQMMSHESLNPDQVQAVGQAVAARTHGGQIGMSTKPNSTGAKDAPIYVVVEESTGSQVFRWIRFFLYFGFICYISLVLVSFVVETTGVLKNVRGAQNNEAQPQHQKVRFSDVHGCDEAKDELQELVEFLSNPERFSSLGGKLPKGVLLVGPPGTGKTLLARAVAGEAGVPFFYMSGSEFDEIYVGVGAKRVRELFNQARTKAPAIIFIDELDAIGAKRNERDAAYVKQTLNQLLTELDGFSQSSGVIILAATNYPQLLDKALTRPGRFDRKVVVGLPDVRGRVDILKHHMKNVQISTDVDAAVIARGTSGFSGADLENLVNQAAVHASRYKKAKVGPLDFDWAKDKIIMGAETRSRVLRDEEKLLTAYHEAGHALVAYFSPAAMPLYKITIVPRGMSLGVTHFLPEMDIYSKNYTEYLADIDVSMGGKAAEELIYGPEKVTSGSAADLRSATETAFSMVTQMGYSKKLGNVDLSFNYDALSSETKQEIEAEVRRIVDEASSRAKIILKERREELELVTKALLEYETLTKEEMEKILRGEKLEKLEVSPKAPIILPDALLGPGLNPPTGEKAASE